MRRLLSAFLLSALFAAAPASAQDSGEAAWIETTRTQAMPSGATVTVLSASDTALWEDVQGTVQEALTGRGYAVAEGASLRLRVDVTEPRGVSVGRGPNFDLLGGGGDNSNTSIGGRVILDFEDFDGPPTVPPQRVSMRLYQVGGGTLWLGTAETPLYGQARTDVAERLALALIDRLDTDTPRQALD